MKRLAFLLILLIILLCPKIVLAADEMTFRKTTWGMSLNQVKASESVKLFKQGENELAGKTTVVGKDMFLYYEFIDNQLVRANYMLLESHINKNDYITDYEDFKKILTKKYGRPKKDEIIWKNDLFKDSYSDWGQAVSIGHLVYRSTWKTPCTEIVLVLTGDNFEIGCLVAYTGKNFVKLIEKFKDQKRLDSF